MKNIVKNIWRLRHKLKPWCPPRMRRWWLCKNCLRLVNKFDTYKVDRFSGKVYFRTEGKGAEEKQIDLYAICHKCLYDRPHPKTRRNTK